MGLLSPFLSFDQSSASKPMGHASNQLKECSLAESLATDGLMHQPATSQLTLPRRILWDDSLAHDGLINQHIVSCSARHTALKHHQTHTASSRTVS